jgi:4-hydroxybenzoate polyprenyltransferase
VAFALTAWVLGGTLPTYAALGLSFALMAVYDLWGKRTPFPPLTDFAQGVAWGGLVLYGASAVAGRITALTGAVVAFVIVYVLLINGVHGGLRDLANDLGCGMRTTAIMFGARPLGEAGAAMGTLLVIYSIVLQALANGVLLFALIANWFGYPPLTWLIMLVVLLSMTALSWFLFRLCFRSLGNRWSLIFAGTWHTSVTLSSLVVLFIPYMGRTLLIALLAAYIGPLLTSGWLYEGAVKWLWRWSGRAARPVPHGGSEPL